MKKIILLLLITIVLSGCGANIKRKSEDILMARDCGLDGFQCCNETPSCSYGQNCCIDPNNPSRNRCLDECACGKNGGFCCVNEECEEGLACINGDCVACGTINNACCNQGNDCNLGLSCFNGKCLKCGEIGGPCCYEGICFENPGERAECKSNICNYCGFGQNPSCSSGDKCLSGHLYNNDKCLKCGEYNQPCCDDDSGLGYNCNLEKNLVCRLGFCAKAINIEPEK